MSTDWVDEATKENRVTQVSRHLASFCDGASNNTRKSTCKSELEEPELHVGVAHEEESRVTDERFACAGAIISSISEGITDGPKSKGSSSRIEQIPQKHVLDVLLSDATRTQHGEAKLHEEDECTRVDEIE